MSKTSRPLDYARYAANWSRYVNPPRSRYYGPDPGGAVRGKGFFPPQQFSDAICPLKRQKRKNIKTD